jgi:broad specificity phosphatase PhoE/L-rhamnose mutarotase
MTDSDSHLPRVYLVRHGETAWSLSRQLTGRANIPLTPRGEQAARELGAILRAQSFAQVWVSPLQRARQTAALAGVGVNALVETDLLEWDYGDYEGRRTAEVEAERPGWNLFDDGCPGGESIQDIDTRAGRIVGRLRALAQDVLVVAHRDIIRMIIARWLGLQPSDARRFYLDTASISILGYHPGADDPVIRTLNLTRESFAPSGKRYGQVLKLRPEHLDEYVRHHAQVWPEILAQIRRSNIRNYSIYLRDGILFAYFEYVGTDFDADMRAMAADASTQRWWALMEPMQEKWPTATSGEWWSNMTEVFHLD